MWEIIADYLSRWRQDIHEFIKAIEKGIDSVNAKIDLLDNEIIPKGQKISTTILQSI